MTGHKHNFPPSSGTNGFFQDPPLLTSAFEEDETLKAVYRFYLPQSVQTSVETDLEHFSNLVTSPKIRLWCADAERNTPKVIHYDSWGRRIDELVTSEGWRNLQHLGISQGIVAIGHEPDYGRYARTYQFLKYHIWTPWNACVTCPSAMTDGAARLLKLQLQEGVLSAAEKKVFESAYEHLVSRDTEKAWTSGQWMTERPGGSDVGSTETQATYSGDALSTMSDIDGNPLGPYSISGFKWFSSATDANATVLLAREPAGGISAFFAPTRRRIAGNVDTELNGISIQRLKNKLGTRALPTAELVLNDMRAWRIGKEGHGTKEISTVLNITRVHNAVTAVGLWGRGLAISRAFSKVRTARGRLLMDTPAHLHTLAAQHVEYRAMMHLTFYTAALLGAVERPSADTDQSAFFERAGLAPKDSVPHLLRLLTPLAKMLTARAAIAGLAECMESLGGVGYLENEDIAMNIARLYRDVNVLSIWEGTTNIMADDVIRTVKGSAGPAVLGAVTCIVDSAADRLRAAGRADWANQAVDAWARLRNDIQKRTREELVVAGRTLATELGWLICALLLGTEALANDAEVVGEICTRWFSRKSPQKSLPEASIGSITGIDQTIIFGSNTSMPPSARL